MKITFYATFVSLSALLVMSCQTVTPPAPEPLPVEKSVTPVAKAKPKKKTTSKKSSTSTKKSTKSTSYSKKTVSKPKEETKPAPTISAVDAPPSLPAPTITPRPAPTVTSPSVPSVSTPSVPATPPAPTISDSMTQDLILE